MSAGVGTSESPMNRIETCFQLGDFQLGFAITQAQGLDGDLDVARRFGNLARHVEHDFAAERSAERDIRELTQRRERSGMVWPRWTTPAKEIVEPTVTYWLIANPAARQTSRCRRPGMSPL